MNQKELAEWLDVTPRQIRNWIDEGVFPRPRGRAGYDLRRCALALLEHYRKKSPAQKDPEAPVGDLQAEIDRERLEKLRLENQRLREVVKELAPMEVLERYAMQLGSTVHEGLEALPGNIRKRVTHLRAAEMTLIKQEVAKIANALVDFNPDHPRAA